MKVACPICSLDVEKFDLNLHLDQHLETQNSGSEPKSNKLAGQQAQWSSFLGKRQNTSAKDKNSVSPASKPSKLRDTEPKPRPSDSSPKPKSAENHSLDSNRVPSGLAAFNSDDNQSNDSSSTLSKKNPELTPTKSVHIAAQPEVVKKPTPGPSAPLAERMRPRTFEDYIGQEQILDILKSLSRTNLPSIILYGPSGSGKTTLARVLAHETKSRFVELSAPSASTNDIKKIVETSRSDKKLLNRTTLLFLDEIHRFSRSQQDSLLQGVERGDFVLIGATTENPSFRLSGALLSRTKLITLTKLSTENLIDVCKRADPQNLVSEDITKQIAAASSGDARKALNMMETALSLISSPESVSIDFKTLFQHVQNYDQKTDNHYDMISAFHKSIRGSNDDAALYYLARMLAGGEDPVYVARRMVRMASEDIGLADDTCLPFAIATMQSVQLLGMPECDVPLAHCAVKLARAGKSVEVYKAYKQCYQDVKTQPEIGNAEVPLHLRNAPTKLMAEMGYGVGYKYNPDYEGEVDQTYMPDSIKDLKYFRK